MYLERGHPPASSLKTFLISCPRLFRKREKPLIKARGRYHSSAPLSLLLSICSWTEEKEENEVSRVQITFFYPPAYGKETGFLKIYLRSKKKKRRGFVFPF
uniref:Uncharacterized protein n=1 Tax=Cacopsylla melanoneura TaxID=428564 RepID=A0A8D9BCV0_9HEMI